jgi:hypothetical protein
VPAIGALSALSEDIESIIDTCHPEDRRFYPTTPDRVRVMALGGPFKPWFDYRQELAGHMHYGIRCCICLEVVGKYRPYRDVWSMTWCHDCHNYYMLGETSLLILHQSVLRRGIRRLRSNCSNPRTYSTAQVFHETLYLLPQVATVQIRIPSHGR